MVADGCEARSLKALVDRLTAAGAVVRFVGATLGPVTPAAGAAIEVDASFEATPSVLYDAIALPGGPSAVTKLKTDGRVLEFIKDQYRHCKPILAFGEGVHILAACGIPTDVPDTGLIIAKAGAADAAKHAIGKFVSAMAKHRHYDRETDPPRV